MSIPDLQSRFNVGTTSSVLINISIPEKCVERNIEWNLNDTVESLKYYVLKLLSDLEDPLNYGFFLPASNGKIGKFLQEHRILSHYLLEEPYNLQLKRKVRINYSIAPKLKNINSKSNQKQFLAYIRQGELMKINKYLNNGLDPNFHVIGLQETPLTLACRLQDPHKIIMALVSNGAYLDFRTTDSLTALHIVSKDGLYEPMKTLLQLGQSPNCKDNKGYTPLYYCIENDAPAECVNLLLYEHSIMGVRDEQGFQEIHKACVYGRTIHLDHLLSYGADIDAKTNKGSTALHICAVHNQGSCARLLLYRGITRYSLDSENKSAYQTALLSNNLEIADLIQNFKDEDVVPVTCLSKFNEKRRSIVPQMMMSSSMNAVDYDNDDNSKKYNFNKTEIMKNMVNDNLYASMQSLPVVTSISSHKSHSTIHTSHYDDNQSLKNFPALSSDMNKSHLNTWSSPDYKMKPNSKVRIPIASITSSKLENIPRTIVLQKGSHGFGFVIRGIKCESELITKPHFPATQYFDCITENSPAHYAGLLKGDYLLEINYIDVHEMSHESVVKIIQKSGDCLTLKVITINQITAAKSNISDTKSNSDSQSIISENRNSVCTINSDATDNQQIHLVDTKKDNTNMYIKEETIQNFPLVLSTDTQKFENSQCSSFSIGLKKTKLQAPQPPSRNDNTGLSSYQNIDDQSKSIYDYSSGKIEVNDLSIITRNGDQCESYKIKKIQSIPPPDYSSDKTSESISLSENIKTFKSSISADKHKIFYVAQPITSVTTQFQPPPPPPPPVLPSKLLPQNQSTSIGVPNVTMHINSEVLSNVLLKPISQIPDSHTNNSSTSIFNDHSEALKFAVLKHREKIECGESQTDNIEDKLKENKVGNKSLIFEAGTISSPQIEMDKYGKNIDQTIDICSSANVSKNPTILPKPKILNIPSLKPQENDVISNDTETNLKLKAENLRINLMKKEYEIKKGTLYFTNEK